MDLTSIVAATQSLGTAANLAKSFLELKSLAEVQAKVIELQSVILSAQSSALAANAEQAAMLQRIRDLEEEIADIKAWEETKQRYKLIQPWEGGYVYALKADSGTTEPPHWICTNCYEDGRKSILNLEIDQNRRRIFVCSHCNRKFADPKSAPVKPEYV